MHEQEIVALVYHPHFSLLACEKPDPLDQDNPNIIRVSDQAGLDQIIDEWVAFKPRRVRGQVKDHVQNIIEQLNGEDQSQQLRATETALQVRLCPMQA